MTAVRAAEPLVDTFGRVHTKLRVSVTDRCNLRCTYCMPAEGAVFLPRKELLTFEEIVRVVAAVAPAGVRRVRLTGGEPLVRTGVAELAEMIGRVAGVEEVGLTTNALLLPKYAADLRAAGVTHVNISLDALDAEAFERVTRRDDFERTMAGVEAAVAADFPSIKLNAVSMRGLTEDQLLPFAEFARRTGLEVRFIEYMPLDADAAWERDKVLFGADILRLLGEEFGPMVPLGTPGPAPATRYAFADGVGTIGVIPSVSEPFCGHCDRFRLTADGRLRSCLFSLDETDVRSLVRGGGTDAEILDAARDCIRGKWSGHRINLEDFRQPSRPMHSIGG